MVQRVIGHEISPFRHFIVISLRYGFIVKTCAENCWISVKHVHNFFLIKPTDEIISQIYFVKKLYMFRAGPLPIIRSFPLYIRHWYMSCRFDESFQARRLKAHQTCMICTSAECTVEKSWWWREELPETCRVSWQNTFGKLYRLLVLLKRNLLQCAVSYK